MGSIACIDNQWTSPAAARTQQNPPLRVEKVLDVKRQLAEGRYDVAEKLDVVLDRLLEDLLAACRQRAAQ
jgi:hypothetical protein